MYDLRYAKRETKNNRKKHHRGRDVPSTKPYLVFDNYAPQIHHTIDINKELGLLASATQDRQNIGFYSLADGSIVPSPTSLRGPTPDTHGNITQIRFEEYQYPMHQRQAPRLLYSQGANIIELAW
ncbi:hypothetical protein TSTA_045930 [Talaromyces stipitatus ATCC 10500]|uniref:Uncharacterized protein n=1 Tax=Talaromyces stipitatus (strain ATCC 10500 / CBS 375.48 / QM 6759 / NRRL 1006) TaxID=441959 RepID=B8MIP5_TALSN|nr:uncharacterized protein TSTA_045930 [Talaromyces stipitatus ATCC 10500]EED15137.1 hypothetical protein TSTA_045930 [Talaromyces stipitatus ATCC 10500]